MSYCRWSSDDYQSDIYAYESETGFITHVALGRYVFKGPLPPPVSPSADFAAWHARHKRVLDMAGVADTKPIGLPHDGETSCHNSPGECADELERLRKCGYKVPQHAIDALREEQAELG